MPERKFASTGSRTQDHQVMSPTCSPLSYAGGTAPYLICHLQVHLNFACHKFCCYGTVKLFDRYSFIKIIFMILFQKGQPFLSKDKSSYHIPLLVRIPTVPIQSSTIQLEVQAKPVTRHTPCWLSSPTRDGSSSLYHEETNLSSSIGKTGNAARPSEAVQSWPDQIFGR